MHQLDPKDAQELSFALHKAVRLSGHTLTEITRRLKHEYDVEISSSGLSHSINRRTIRFQRALQKLKICGVNQVVIGGAAKEKNDLT
jgi:hypothetical protein